MPWELQVCRFCQKKYGNKTGLRRHLIQYIDEWRIPADGIHDVLEIQRILYPEDDDNEYQCPSRDCREIIATRQKFIQHVVTKLHWGGFPEGPLRGSNDANDESVDLSNISEWVLPFDEKVVKIFKPEGPFPLLRLPPELRTIVYEMTLCCPGINICAMKEEAPSPRQAKVFLQRNRDNNPLSLLMTSRGIYDEARSVFYSKNKFTFANIDAVPIFLIGIGQENAKLLRSLRLMPAGEDQFENQLSTIRQHIWGINGQDSTNNKKLDIWNDHTTYLDLLEKIGRTSCMYPLPEPHRFILWNPRNTGHANRVRFKLHCHFSDTIFKYMHGYERWNAHVWHGEASYELILHVEKND
ncbi:hypothetical protein EYB26_006874 [Talaromyces marneffei]|nr:uncharacterized protein EYB26_006874 [Talaromyces marneffei]QGA19186.1 hypothetical protein EYB26_006874 [Talaromyces marneffei]